MFCGLASGLRIVIHIPVASVLLLWRATARDPGTRLVLAFMSTAIVLVGWTYLPIHVCSRNPAIYYVPEIFLLVSGLAQLLNAVFEHAPRPGSGPGRSVGRGSGPATPIGPDSVAGVEEASRCPVCSTGFTTRPVRCLTCGAPHHGPCYSFNGGCAIYGCAAGPRIHGAGRPCEPAGPEKSGGAPDTRPRPVAQDSGSPSG